ACDDIVLNTGTTASTYAQHLLQSATATPVLRFVTAALAMARPSSLESRLQTILDARRNRRGLSGSATWMTLGLLLIALVPVAVLRAQDDAGGASDGASVNTTTPRHGASAATRPTASSVADHAGARGSFGRATSLMPAPAMGEGPTCPFDATIYELRLA